MPQENLNSEEITNSLGVLLWAVARADGRLEEGETARMKEILSQYGVAAEELEALISHSKIEDEKRTDIYKFVRRLAKNFDYEQKTKIIKTLFDMAFSDKQLSSEELEFVRKIANIFSLSHRDFIEAKLQAKKQAGMKVWDL